MRNEYRAFSGSIDRRSFIVNAGLAAAGSALGSSLTACSDVVVNLPCLGPAAPPTPVPGMTYIKASEIGCALNCDLGTGRNKHTGGSATDDGPKINAAMAGATADHPITLIIDGSALISGLFLPAEGYWGIAGLGCGTGFFIKKGTNNDGIHNGPPRAAIPFDPGPPAPTRGQNVTLSNFTVNGNQGDGRHGVSTSGFSWRDSQQFFCAIDLMNLDNIRIENVVVVNSPAYHFRLTNVGNVTVSGCVMHSGGPGTDGLHFDGPANDITIKNCDFKTGDDSIALNAPEGYSGNISRVAVANCTFDSWTLMRIYTTGARSRDQVDSVTVSQCSGRLSESAFLIGLSAGSIPESVATLTVSDCDLTAPAILGMAENFGHIVVKGTKFTPSRSGADWGHPVSNRICAFLRPSPQDGAGSCIGSTLEIQNCQIVRNSDTDAAALVIENGSAIANVVFDGFGVLNQGTFPSMPALLVIGSGSIGQLAISSVDSGNIALPLSMSEFVNVGTVTGAGVLGTSWQFPDAVMADEVPYISASTGRPSIKLAGVVQPYLPA